MDTNTDDAQAVTRADLRVAIAELETRLIDRMTSRDWRLLLAMTAIVGIAVAILKV